MATTNITLQDIISNLETAIADGQIMGASRITLNNHDLLSLLLAIQNELDKKRNAGR